MHYRKSVRLRGYDYSQEGGYFITICTFAKKSLLGCVKGDGVELSQVGNIASQFWCDMPKHFENVRLDEFVVMPNHIHGIIMIERRT
jgi:putative transposase